MKAMLAVLALLLTYPDDALARDPKQRATFYLANPCPATGKLRGPCPGFVVDHIRPLCAGGSDTPANMQWQTTAQARDKDRQELALCREIRKAGKAL